MAAAESAAMPRVTDILADDGLIETCPPADPDTPVGDLTREPLTFPAGRDLRLQNLTRGDEGFLLALGYSTQRGYGRTHPFAGEIRLGEVEVEFMAEEVGFAVPLGRVTVTECQMITQFCGSATEPPQFTRGYGLAFGHSERKAMAMALVDRALRARDLGEERRGPAQDEEFVLSHSDNVQATGFVEHLKLPHYVDFQAELGLIRRMRAEIAASDDLRKEAAE
jgi:alpha-D-ribose 1-methylphosphonate 5-triphosphate synthase subunit PhnI